MKRISKWLKFLATGSVSLFLSACYGVQQEFQLEASRRVTVNTKSEEGTLIPGLRVSFQYAGEETTNYWNPLGETNDSGSISFELQPSPTDNIYIKIEDIDKEVNGLYQSQVFLYTDSVHTVTMKSQ